MIPENLKFGGTGGDPASIISICLMLLAGILVLFVRKKYVVYPFLFGALIIPYAQVILIGTVHLQMLRFLTMFGMIRLILEWFVRNQRPLPNGLHAIDRAYIYFTVVSAITFVLLNQEFAAFTNRIGVLFDSFCIYFILRFLISDEEEVTRAIKAMVIVACLAAVFMSVEQVAGKNLFGYLGGVPLEPTLREGRLRSQGFFAHALIAGSYGAVLLPLSVWLWLKGGAGKIYAIACIFSATIMTLTSASSTPILAFVAGIGAFAFWPLRRQMRWIQWGTVLMLCALHIIMKGPVWALIDHIDLVGGNSANHRYMLVDQCIRHFWDWWLVGTNDNVNWGWDMWDTCNYYVNTAEGAGILALILLFWLIARIFQNIGRARAAFETDNRKQLMFWSLGAMMFAQCIAYFGIAYFDQAVVAWYALIAIVIALTSQYVQVPAPEPSPIIKPEPDQNSARLPWRVPPKKEIGATNYRERVPSRTSSLNISPEK
jgi:hypothetical protein